MNYYKKELLPFTISKNGLKYMIIIIIICDNIMIPTIRTLDFFLQLAHKNNSIPIVLEFNSHKKNITVAKYCTADSCIIDYIIGYLSINI